MFFGDRSCFSAGIHPLDFPVSLGTRISAQTHLHSAESPVSTPHHRLFSNRRKMNTCVKLVTNFSGMNTYAMLELKSHSE